MFSHFLPFMFHFITFIHSLLLSIFSFTSCLANHYTTKTYTAVFHTCINPANVFTIVSILQPTYDEAKLYNLSCEHGVGFGNVNFNFWVVYLVNNSILLNLRIVPNEKKLILAKLQTTLLTTHCYFL